MDVDTATRVRTYIVDTFLLGDSSAMVTDDDSLLRQGIIDSTGVLDLMMFIEEEFGVQVDDDDVVPGNFDSVASLVRYLEAKRGVIA